MITAFRIFLLSAIALIIWFALINLNDGPSRGKRTAIPQSNMKSACENRGQIAITIDEGPATATVDILNSLSANSITATFHVVTKYLENIAVATNLENAWNANHVIGLRFPTTINPKDLSDKELKETLIWESYLIFKKIGVYPKYLRFALGEANDRILKIAKELGFIVTGWNVDTNDYKNGITGKEVVEAYDKALGEVAPGTGKFISLHRDLYSVYSDQSIFAEIKAKAAEKEYALVPLSTCMNQPAYRENNKDPTGTVPDDYARNRYNGSSASQVTSGSMNIAIAFIVAFVVNFVL